MTYFMTKLLILYPLQYIWNLSKIFNNCSFFVWIIQRNCRVIDGENDW